MNRALVVLYDIPMALYFPATKKNMISVIEVTGPIHSIAIPGREFYLELNGHDTLVRSTNGVLYARDVRKNMPEAVLIPMSTRLTHLGYSPEDIDNLLIFNMLNHVRIIFTGGPKDCAPCYVLFHKKLAFFDRPHIRLVPGMEGAIPKAQISHECTTLIKPTHNEFRIWQDGVSRNRLLCNTDDIIPPIDQ